MNIGNIERISKATLTKKDLELFTPAQRSDAAMIVLMTQRSGIFVDADTLMLPNFDYKIYFNLKIPTMYASFHNKIWEPHLAFLANSGNYSKFMEIWNNELLISIAKERNCLYRKFRREFRKFNGKTVHVKWDYLGRKVFNKVRSKINPLNEIYFQDADLHKFLPEFSCGYYSSSSFIEYWLSQNSLSLFNPNDYSHGIVTFQNSWLPGPIRNLRRSEILNHPSRFGRVFHYTLCQQ